MQTNPSDAITFAVVLCLPFVVWVVSRPPIWSRVRTRVDPVGLRLWRQLSVQEQPDELILWRWAVVRLEGLRDDLARVRRLVLDDEWMTATRQTGNRMAYEHLLHDVREAERAVEAFGPIEEPAAPTPVAQPRFTFAAPASHSAVEVMEFGPSGRWL